MPRHPETVIFAEMKLLSSITFNVVWEIVVVVPMRGSVVVSVATTAKVVLFTVVEEVTVTVPASTFEVLAEVVVL